MASHVADFWRVPHCVDSEPALAELQVDILAIANPDKVHRIEKTIPQAHNTQAAECHEAAGKSHWSAAELHAKSNDKARVEQATKAKAQSEDANKASIVAQAKSAATHP